MKYLENIPVSAKEYGLCKVLAVRFEIINIKHIFTEIFVRKKITIDDLLKKIDMSLFDYMEYMTNRIRHIYNFPRNYKCDINIIIQKEKSNFFPLVDSLRGMKNCIIIDFDGVVNKNNFKELYELCIQRCKTIICSANPTILEGFFPKNGLSLPYKIYSEKGKTKKIKRLLDIHSRHDNCFYIDNEDIYLQYAWIFGINSYKWNGTKIKKFTMNNPKH